MASMGEFDLDFSDIARRKARRAQETNEAIAESLRRTFQPTEEEDIQQFIAATGRADPRGRLKGATPGLEWSPTIRPPDHAPPGGVAGEAPSIAASERRMEPRRIAAGIDITGTASPEPGAVDGGEAAQIQDQTSVNQASSPRPLSAPGERLEAPGGYMMAESRSPGGSGEAWVREQAVRRQGPQVHGFDASQIPPPPQRGGIQAPPADAPSLEQEKVAAATRPKPTVAQGPVEDDRTVGTWGIPQGIRRSPQPPGAQERWQREFQDTESARYRDYDITQAAQEAELAKQQTLTEDPFAQIGAETAGRKELIEAEGEAQKGLFGAQAEAEEGVHRERGLEYDVAAKTIQNTYNSEREKLESAGYDQKELDDRIAELDQKLAIDMSVLQTRVYGVQGMRYGYDPQGYRFAGG